MKRLFLVIIFLINISIQANAQQTIILQPDGSKGLDAYLDELNPNSNFGNYRDVGAWYWTFNGSPGTGRSLLKFDLSSIPAGVSIVSASLSLFHNPASSNAGQAGSNTAFLQRVISPWQENSVTWNTQPNTTTADQIILSASTSGNQNYTNIDVTKIVTDMYLNPQNNFGWMLRLQVEQLYTSMKFASSDQASSAIRPKLEIKYTLSTISTTTQLTLCPDDELSLQGRSGYSNYLWNTGSTNQSILVNKPGTYSVRITTPQFIISDTFKVTASELKQPDLGSNFTICPSDSESRTINVFQPNATYKWQNGSTSPDITITSPGQYWVEVSVGSCKLTDTVTVFESCFAEPSSFFIPNIISPNNDQLNDYFIIQGLGTSSLWTLQIFNRWGNSIYKSEHYDNEWDGKECTSGMYYYILINKTTHEVFKGWVEVVR